MQKLVFNDGKNIEIQSTQSSDGKLYIRMLMTNSEELKTLFMDEFAVRKMTVYENDTKIECYENYNKLSYIKEEIGSIWEVEMIQEGKDDATLIAELTKELDNANSQITALQLALVELYESKTM
ncbi:hypothetical protein [Faecalimonas sp.]